MAKFTVCYDLDASNNPHSSFIEAAISLGWQTWVRGTDKKWHKLPDTTLRGEFGDHAAALKAFKAIKPAAEKLLGQQILIEKYYLVESSGVSLTSNEVRDTKP